MHQPISPRVAQGIRVNLGFNCDVRARKSQTSLHLQLIVLLVVIATLFLENLPLITKKKSR
jgi:hypothetical protein